MATEKLTVDDKADAARIGKSGRTRPSLSPCSVDVVIDPVLSSMILVLGLSSLHSICLTVRISSLPVFKFVGFHLSVFS